MVDEKWLANTPESDSGTTSEQQRREVNPKICAAAARKPKLKLDIIVEIVAATAVTNLAIKTSFG